MRHIASSLLGIGFTFIALLLIASGCNYKPATGRSAVSANGTSVSPGATPTPPPTQETARLLTICMAQEPSSLFLYGDASQSARTIRQAIYDGPVDIHDHALSPVVLEKIPTLADGDLTFETVTVQPGGALVDSAGLPAGLTEGVAYLPTGCSDASCAAAYSGQGPVQVDQQVVKFKLKSGLKWSDGEPLLADDSQYSFELAKSLYPRARADVIARTQSYQTLDETTLEWRGLPGFHYSGYMAAFFTPLPRHAWGNRDVQALLSDESVNRAPLGWGAYVIDEWTPGDHISLSRNDYYWRSSEGLPNFDRLVFRFIPDPAQAVSALLAGECDYLDETNDLRSQWPALMEAQSAGKVKLLESVSDAWELLDFGISPLNTEIQPIFAQKEARQAVALCTDRQKIIDELFDGKSIAPNSFAAPGSPLTNPGVKQYAFDPSAANELLESAGWKDDDANPATPRHSQGVAGLPDGTPFTVNLALTSDPEKQRLGELLRDSLAQCGISLEVQALPADQLFSSGPNGPIFGRQFSLAEFGWMGAWQPPCYLFTTQEIPGPYPEYPKGWGGANPGGYSRADFDLACQRALALMPEEPGYQAAHFLAQAIFAEDLPALPLYLRPKRAATRSDLCGLNLEPSADSALWNLENFQIGSSCP